MFDEQAKLFQEYIKLNEGEQVKFEELKDNEKEFHVITLYIYKLISTSRHDEAYYILSIPRIKDIIYRGYPDITPIRFFVHQFDDFSELLSLCLDSVLHRNMTMARTAMSIVDTRLSQMDTAKIQKIERLINQEKGFGKFAKSTLHFGGYNEYPALFYEDFKESEIDEEVLSEHNQAENMIALAMDLHNVKLYDLEIYYLERLIKCRPDNKEVHICLAAAKLSEAISYRSFPDGIAYQVVNLYYKLIQLLNNDSEKSAFSLAFYEYIINISGKYLDQWRGKEPDRLISICSFYNMLLNLYYIYPLKRFLYLIEEGIIKFDVNAQEEITIHFQEQMKNILLHRDGILLKNENQSDYFEETENGINSLMIEDDLYDSFSFNLEGITEDDYGIQSISNIDNIYNQNDHISGIEIEKKQYSESEDISKPELDIELNQENIKQYEEIYKQRRIRVGLWVGVIIIIAIIFNLISK